MTHHRHMKKNERGAALLEFALVFGIFVFVLYGLIAFGMMMSMKQNITHAATEGARAAIGVAPGDTSPANGVDDRIDAAKARVASALNGWNSAQKAQTVVDVTFPPPSICPTSCIDVHL